MPMLRYRQSSEYDWKGIAAIKGEDGKTPVKGVDYFTPSDVEDFTQKAANKVDLSDYATRAYVADEIVKVSTGGSVNLSDYATTTYVNNALAGKADLEHTHEQYLTEHQDLSAYAKLTDLETKADREHTHSQYLTEHQSLEAYALKEDIPAIPTEISAFNNDVGYLTEHQSLEEYAKLTDIPDISVKADKEHTHEQYSLTTHTHTSFDTDITVQGSPVLTVANISTLLGNAEEGEF